MKILEKNEKIAISLENKIDNDFIITAGNLLIDLSNCDNKKAQQESDSENPFSKLDQLFHFREITPCPFYFFLIILGLFGDSLSVNWLVM